MDEYFCPNCGAILNDQYGFEPSCGTWTCTCCGKHLMDDDIYDGDLYTGVAWYCDECGALLNRQQGFSDIYGSWTCTECGYSNSITESDIYESEEDYERNRNGSGVLAELFSTMIEACFEARSQKREREREEEAERQAEAERIRLEKEKAHKAQRALRRKRAKAFLFKGKKIEIHYDYEELIGNGTAFVTSALTEDAFSNIKTVPVKDIYTGSEYSVGQVERVIIGGSSSFGKGDLIPYDAEIVIFYHDKREISIPFSGRSLQNMNYVLAGNKLQELGFTEIYEKPIRDLTMGWVKKDGAVEKITIGGICPFKKDSVFAYDVEIVIEYHTFKKR